MPDRRFLLLPTPMVEQTYLFSLAYAADKHGVHIHAVGTTSNHDHMVLTDVHGNRPDFYRDFRRTLTSELNIERRRMGTMWERKPTSEVVLLTPEKQLEKMIYCVANPPAADLVAKAASWPGFTTARYGFGQDIHGRRRHHYNERSTLPLEASLKLHKPPAFAHISDAKFDAMFRDGVRARELMHRRERQRNGRIVVGVAGVLKRSIEDKPTTKERVKAPVPKVAGGTAKERAKFKKVVRIFQESYAHALARLQAFIGAADQLNRPIFPPGTWRLWREGLVERDDGSGGACRYSPV